MPVLMLDAVDFTKVPALQFVAPVVSSDPTGYEAGLIYNSTEKALKYHNGTAWVALGAAGAGGPPSGAAGGELAGTYPTPNIAKTRVAAGETTGDGVGTAAANAAALRAIGPGANQVVAGNDSRLTDSRAPNGAAGGDLTGSTYPNPVIANNAVTNAKLADMPTLTIKGNATGATADPTDMTVATVKGFLTYTKTDVGLGNVDNTSDANKPVSSATTTALAGKADTTTDHIAGAGLTGGGTLAASRTFNVGAGTGITVNADDVAINRTVVDTWYVDVGGDTMTGFLTLNADPTNPMHAVTKQYADIGSQGFTFKNAVKAVSTTNITLSGTQTIDGVAVVANDRVLVAGQTTASQNGIYLCAAGAWTRATDMDANGELKDGTLVPVAAGTANGDSQFMCTATGADPWVVNTSTSTWTRYSGVADVTAGAGMIRNGQSLDIQSANVAHMTVGADSLTIVSAPKWTTAQTLTLSGDISGSVSFDGSGAINMSNTAIGAGVIVDADIAAGANIAQTKISGLGTSLSGKVDTTRQVLAGNGLTGGGALSADVTLNVVGDANLSVTADQVAVLSAPKWTTTRTIALSGDVTSSAINIDGSGNVTIPTTVAVSGVKRYAADLPAVTGGVAVQVTHSLGTQDLVVQVIKKATMEVVQCGVTMFSTTRTDLMFAASAASGTYRVVIVG